MQPVHVLKIPEDYEKYKEYEEEYLGVVENPNQHIVVYDVDELAERISKLTTINPRETRDDPTLYNNLTLFLDTSIARGAPIFLFKDEYGTIADNDIRGLIWGRSPQGKKRLMSTINDMRSMHMAHIASRTTDAHTVIGPASSSELEYRTHTLERSISKSEEPIIIPGKPGFRLIRGGDLKYFQGYEENELLGIQTMLKASAKNRLELESILSGYPRIHTFFTDLFLAAYQEVYRIESNTNLLGRDYKVMAEPLTYSSIIEEPVNLLVMDRHFNNMLAVLARKKEWFYNNHQVLEGRSFNVTIYKLRTPNSRSDRLSIVPSMKIDYYDGRLGIYELSFNDKKETRVIPQSHIILI